MSDFNDFVDTEGLGPDEEARLRRVHELLLEAGPPADLPPGLARPGAPPTADIVQFPKPRRRIIASILVAAALAVAVFGSGYLFGHSKAKPAAFDTGHVVTMHSTGAATGALAVLKVAPSDSAGNWSMEMTVQGLPQQPQRDAYYELWLTKNGKPVAGCGTFRVHAKATTVEFTIPYNLKPYDGWVVTAHRPGQPEPGRVILTT